VNILFDEAIKSRAAYAAEKKRLAAEKAAVEKKESANKGSASTEQ